MSEEALRLPERPRKREGLVREELEGMDEVIYLDEDTASHFALNATAAAVLELCDGTRTVEEIADVIAAATQAPPDEVRKDVQMILTEFLGYGLIQPASE